MCASKFKFKEETLPCLNQTGEGFSLNLNARDKKKYRNAK